MLARRSEAIPAGRATRPYRLLSSVAPTAELERWLRAARPGETAIYAAGTDLPRGAEGVLLVRQWVERGLVSTNQVRDPADAGRWQFLMTKAGGKAERALERQTEGERRTEQRKMMSVLRTCAAANRPCPSNADLAREMGLPRDERGRQRAAYVLRSLIENGSLRVEARGTMEPRVVTILAAGRAQGCSTADPRAIEVQS